jgi:hypothetical protein
VLSTHEIEPPNSIPHFTAAGRRSPPSSASRRRPGACVRLQPSDQDPSVPTCFDPSQSPAAASSRWIFNGSDQVSRVNSGQTRQALAFLKKTPCTFQISQKYPSAVICSFQLGPFITFKPRFFRVLCKLVLAHSIKHILVILAPFFAFFYVHAIVSKSRITLCICFVLLVLFGNCSLFILVVCFYVMIVECRE